MDKTLNFIEMLTVDELAKLLRVSLPTVYSAIRANKIPGVIRVGRILRIHRAAVIDWISSQGRDLPKRGK